MMTDLKKIIWLASYPKSGNTWFRAFLTAFLNDENSNIDINNLYSTPIASSRLLFDEMTGISSADLTLDEINNLRPKVYIQNALESKELIYYKIHDAWTLLPNGYQMFPAEVTKAVIYFIRNPLDVTVSFSNHLSTTIDKTISIMSNPGYAFCSRSGCLHNQLYQRLSTWSGHVKSWVDDSHLPILVIRYEDMKLKPFKSFKQILSFVGLPININQIENAIRLSSFDNLQKQEIEKGFNEKSASVKSFFRKGIVGDWRNVLTREQIQKVKIEHGSLMERFGYLD